MATNPRLPPPPSQNHVITAPPKGVVGGNRKKQKRRAKQAAKVAADAPLTLDDGEPGELDYEEDALGYNDEDYGYSDADHYNNQYVPPHADANGYVAQSGAGTKKKKKKAAKGGDIHHHHHHSPYNPELVGNHLPPIPSPPPPPIGSLRPDAKPGHGDIWNTSTQQERQNIKDFWLSLNEEERKSLLKIEKEAVLRKMKQQQKNSCSCTVCGRKRTAIEEELEVLYEGYYEELEQYAHHDQPPGLSADEMIPGPLQHRKIPHPFEPQAPPNPLHKTSHLHEHLDDDEFSDEDDEEGYSDDDEDYSDEMLSSPIEARCAIPEFFNFGQNLTVKDNILTVADDLLKNDGRKFIEMMESLAERRMQRESEAEYAAANPRHPGAYPPSDSAYNHEDPLAAGDDYEDDDDASYDSQDGYDEDELDEAEDEVSGLTAEQRMQEGRRMFQIFAARMFEQRVLTAYKEKVAAERQQKLLEELEDETKLEAQREAKKQRDAQKKKDKKKQQQAAKAEEKARKDAEKAAEEARVREAEEKKQEEQRRKKEEQRKKKEDEKRRQEEERARKEAEKNRRQQEEQQRREEVERKAKEQKAAEKAKKDEARKREREEREAIEKEARDRKAQEEKEKSEREAKAKAKADKEARERDKSAQQAASQPHPPAQQPPPFSKRSSQSGSVAVPAGAQSRQISSAVPSPHPSVATPVIPKAPTPAAARQRQASQQNSLTSSPKQPQSQVSSAPSKSSSPISSAPSSQLQQAMQASNPVPQKAGYQNQQAIAPPMQHHHHQNHHAQSTSPLEQPPMQPPPGMSYPQQHQQPQKHSGAAFGGISPVGHPGLQGSHPNQHMMHGNMGARASPMPMYPPSNQHVPHMGMQNTRYGPPGINGQQQAVVGASHQSRPGGYPLDVQQGAGAFPAGFAQPQGHLSQPSAHQSSPPFQPQVSSAAPGAEMHQQRSAIQSHSRQTSMTDKSPFEPTSTSTHPIARPAPIQRPSSVKPQEDTQGDVDDLSKHLGSSALLDDSDEPIPQGLAENRRQSNLAPGASRPTASNLPPGMAPLPFGGPSGFGAPQNSWNSPTLPFGQSPAVGQQGWGGLPTSTIGSWPGSNAGFPNGAVGGFGNIGGGPLHRPSGANFSRPLAIRLAICQACKHLSATGRGGPDGFHDVSLLLHTMNASRPPHEAPPSLREIEEICETEGDAQNGGGELHVRHSPAAGAGFAVMWQPSFPGSTPDLQARAGIGEIGSPLPTKASPVGAGWGGVAPGMVGMGRVPSGGSGGVAGFQSFGAATGPSPPAGPGGS